MVWIVLLVIALSWIALSVLQTMTIRRLKRERVSMVADLVEQCRRYDGLKQASKAIVHLLPDATPRTDSMTMDGGSLERAQARAAEYHHNTKLEPVRRFRALIKEPPTLIESHAAYQAAFGPGGGIKPLPDTARELGPIKFNPTYEEP